MIKLLTDNGLSEYAIVPMPPEDKLIGRRVRLRIPENAKSVIVALFPKRSIPDGSGRASFAIGENYHDMARRLCEPVIEALKAEHGGAWEHFCDNSPFAEVGLAVSAGLGVRGKNNILINEKYGTFFHICEIVTDVELKFTDKKLNWNPCEDCNKCVEACPTHNLPNFERENCISYITQKLKTPVNGWTWGCDICGEVCPWNTH